MTMQGPDFDIPTTFERFEAQYRQNIEGVAPSHEALQAALVGSIDVNQLQKSLENAVLQMQRQYRQPHAKSSSNPNPQNAPEMVAEQAGPGFHASEHPVLKNFLSTVNDAAREAIRGNKAANALLTSFGKDRQADQANFNQLKNELQNKLKHRFAPKPGASIKPRPE